MLTDDFNVSISSKHGEKGINWRDVFDCAEEILVDASDDLKILWKQIEQKGTRSAFFETWSSFWFSSPNLDHTRRVKLAGRMLVSATAIATLDQLVDRTSSGLSVSLERELRYYAVLWDELACELFPYFEPWGAHLPLWLSPRHGAEESFNHRDLLLKKNPFYPSALRTYFFGLDEIRVISEDFAVALGLLDDAADVREDYLVGNPNALFSDSRNFIFVGDISEVRRNILRSNRIGTAISEARQLLDGVERFLKRNDRLLFAETVWHIESSLDNYSELCVARLIMN
jgi:hypothetical protein